MLCLIERLSVSVNNVCFALFLVVSAVFPFYRMILVSTALEKKGASCSIEDIDAWSNWMLSGTEISRIRQVSYENDEGAHIDRMLFWLYVLWALRWLLALVFFATLLY